MSEAEIEDIIKYPNEERHIEFKGTIFWDGEIRAKITKSIMALANLRDGGWIVVGKEEQPDRSFKITGMTQQDYDSFDPDCVKAYVYERVEPPISFQIIKKEYNNEKFVIIRVRGFDEIPIMCKKSVCI
jgi:predicted HTH transcriptional regulator